MAQIIKTISLNHEQAAFIDEHSSISLSKLVQGAINKIMEDTSAQEIEIVQLKRSNLILQEALSNATDQLDKLNCKLEDGKWIC